MSGDSRKPSPAAPGDLADSMSRLKVALPAQPQRSMSSPNLPRVTSAQPPRSPSLSMPSVKLPAAQPAPRRPLSVPSVKMPAAPALLAPPPKYPIRLVVVAASTGGPAALTALLDALPSELLAPLLVVQHMAQEFLPFFVARLAEGRRLQVNVAQGRELVYPGQVWFAPGGRHLHAEPFGRGFRLRLTDTPAVNGCRPSADETLASAVTAADGHVLAIVLSGIGRDGRDGCRLVKAARGHVLVQDAGSADVAEMPEAVARDQLAEGAFPPAELGLRVARKLAYGR